MPGAGLQQADALNQDECCCLFPLHLPSKQWSQPSPWANLQEFCGSKTDREQGYPVQPCCSPSRVHPCKASLKEPSPPVSLLECSVHCRHQWMALAFFQPLFPTRFAAFPCSRPSHTHFGSIIQVLYLGIDSLVGDQLSHLASEPQLTMTSVLCDFISDVRMRDPAAQRHPLVC